MNPDNKIPPVTFVEISHKHYEAADCKGILLSVDYDREIPTASVLVLKDKSDTLVMRVVNTIPMEYIYCVKTREQMNFDEYPPNLYDGNIFTVANDISRWIRRGRKFSKLKELITGD